MKKTEFSLLLPLLGCGVLILGAVLNWSAWVLAASGTAVLLVLFFLGRSNRDKADELQRQCDQLTSDLEVAREDHEQQLAQLRAEQEKQHSDFFSQISHSLRMPLSVIQGYAELMQKGSVDPVREGEYLDRIVQHTHRMIDILSKKLDTSPDDTPSAPSRKRVDLVQVIQQHLEDLKRTALRGGISLQTISSEPSLPVYADSRLLQRILFNLVENSINYMGREGIITVLLTRVDNMARITVRDDGLGLPEHEVPHIFEANFRGSNSSMGKGSGYGLFLMKQAVEAQGGSVSASSAPGRGMAITFTLPLAEEEIPVEA